MDNTDVMQVDARRYYRTDMINGDGDIWIFLAQPIRQICFQRIGRKKIIEEKYRDADDVNRV